MHSIHNDWTEINKEASPDNFVSGVYSDNSLHNQYYTTFYCNGQDTPGTPGLCAAGVVGTISATQTIYTKEFGGVGVEMRHDGGGRTLDYECAGIEGRSRVVTGLRDRLIAISPSLDRSPTITDRSPLIPVLERSLLRSPKVPLDVPLTSNFGCVEMLGKLFGGK